MTEEERLLSQREKGIHRLVMFICRILKYNRRIIPPNKRNDGRNTVKREKGLL